MRLFGLATLFALLSFTSVAEARNNGANYDTYHYSGSSSSNYKAYGYGGGRPSYEGYKLRSSSSTGKYWRGGNKRHSYNDPTGYRYVRVKALTPPVPTGNYGRAVNKLYGTH